MKHFIIVFDRAQGRQIRFEEISNADEATELYREIERESMEPGSEALDVVLVGSDSAESVKITHGSYFAEERSDASSIKRYLDEFAHSHGAAGLNSRRIRSPRVHFNQAALS